MQNALQKEIVKFIDHWGYSDCGYLRSPSYEVRRFQKAAVEIIERKDGVLLDSLCTDESATYEIIQEGASPLLDSRVKDHHIWDLEYAVGMLRIALTHELARRGLTIIEDVYGNNPTNRS